MPLNFSATRRTTGCLGPRSALLPGEGRADSLLEGGVFPGYGERPVDFALARYSGRSTASVPREDLCDQVRQADRDRIPEIIEHLPHCKLRTATEDEYVQYLVRKIGEEADELRRTPSLEEMADLLE